MLIFAVWITCAWLAFNIFDQYGLTINTKDWFIMQLMAATMVDCDTDSKIK